MKEAVFNHNINQLIEMFKDRIKHYQADIAKSEWKRERCEARINEIRLHLEWLETFRRMTLKGNRFEMYDVAS